MKYFVFMLIPGLICLQTACKKDNLVNTDCETMRNMPGWQTKPLKPDYNFQLPDHYEGEGLITLEGPFYLKNRTDSTLFLSYSYCNGYMCTSFGDTLSAQVPDTITTVNRDSDTVSLGNKEYFCRADTSKGILYYNDEHFSSAVFYLKKEDKYLESLSIAFRNDRLDEVFDIIRTIRQSEDY